MPKSTHAYLGIDVGTSAVKAMVVGIDGRILGEASVQQVVDSPRPAWTEQHPDTWWRSSQAAISTAMESARRGGAAVELRGVGLSGQMHSAVFLDSENQVIRPAPLWSDARTAPQCREITDRLGMDGLRDTVGNLALEGFTAPKVVWLRQNEPENYARLRHLMLAKDYVRYRLTGEMATDPSDAAGTLLFDIRQRQWSREVIDALEISGDTLPELVGSADVSGVVGSGPAEALDVPAGTPVVGGGADNAAGAVGSGVVGVGRVLSSIGTSGTLLAPIDRAQVDGRMRLHTFCHCVPDMWYLMGVMLSAGNSLRWLRDILLPSGGDDAYDTLAHEASTVQPGAEGLLFLPYLTGERTPHNDPAARGAFSGLHLGHTRADLVRAVMEGVCFAMRDSLELVRTIHGEVSEVTATGGGSGSDLWLQLQADIYGVPVVKTGPGSGAAYGAAALAAVGAGAFGSIGEATHAWLHVERTVEPDHARVRGYDEIYGAFRELYPALKKSLSEAGQER
jgi:xylulokinase